ncbi:Hypothetical protein DRBB28_0746 [Bifidobacterium breve]|uniref:GtrA/DPMS transmembrane domain-containing protein n=1 Tax=Bifidobacterium breve TaxID=1685 RepID=A0AAN1IDX9_BIFBR|nr:Hypothetical protein DRBB27_0638 [Bifidobacterium breve]AUD92949.1 Hypothetical protein DRBB28_0746 [Bifidobacterium breve]AUE00727.1 Hypothetical protein BB180W83_0591 [Bifidobacterium breve]AUE18204.1 Hypothetical protein DRBB29_0639 [Bifidobacterium breve]
MANNGADVKPNQGMGATNTSTTTNTAENTVGTATPKQNGLAVLGKYVGVSATQTIVEYATFAILHLIGVPSQIANGIAVVCSATYNFVMNRNVDIQIVQQLHPVRGAVRAAMRLVRCGVRNHGGNRLRHHRHATCDVLND